MRDTLFTPQELKQIDAWRTLIYKFVVCHRGHASYAEDVAQCMVMALIAKTKRSGQPVHDCPQHLPHCIRSEVLRKASEMAGEAMMYGGIDEIKPCIVSESEEVGIGPSLARDWHPLEIAFSKEELKAMVDSARQGRTSQEELAAACRMPPRTFRYRLKQLRGD
jgi:hypothetical protein